MTLVCATDPVNATNKPARFVPVLTKDLQQHVTNDEFFVVLTKIRPKRFARTHPQTLIELDVTGTRNKMSVIIDRKMHKGKT